MNSKPANDAPFRIMESVLFGDGVFVHSFTNLYGCVIGAGTRVGPFVEIQRGAAIGARCKIQSHTFICDGVQIGDRVFIGHSVSFVNDRFPRATRNDGTLQTRDDWRLSRVVVHDEASVGTGAIIVGPVEIGRRAIVGAGAVVTHDVPPGTTVAGVPARALAIAYQRASAPVSDSFQGS